MFNGDLDDISNGNMRKNMDSGGIMRGSNSNGNLQNGLEIELESILQPQHNGDVIIGLERDLNMYRSGSAPPSVEGSLSAMGSLFGTPNFVQMDNGGSGTSGSHTDEEIRSHPEYLSYYYSHLNLNPRLPPPLLSKEDWRVAQRFQAMGVSSGGITDWRKKSLIDDGSSSSLFSMQPGLPVQSAEDQLMELRKATTIQNIPRNNSDQWLDRRSDGKFGGYGAGMGRRRRSFADIVQEGLDQPASSSGHPSHSTSRRFQKPIGFSNSHLTVIHNEAEPNGTLNPRAATSYVSGIQNLSSAVESTMSRNRTPGTGPVDNRVYLPENYVLGSNAVNGLSSSMPQLADVAASLTGLSLLENLPPNEGSDIQSQPQMGFAEQPDNDPFDMSNGYAKSLQQRLIDQIKAEKLVIPPNNYADGIMTGFGKPDFDGQVNFRRRTTSPNFQSKTNSYLCANLGGSNSYYQSDDPSGMIFYGHVPNGYSSNQKLNTMIDNHLSSGSTLNSPGNGRSLRGSSLADLPSPDRDPRYIQYLQKTSNYGTPFSGSPNNQFERRNIGTSHGHGDFHGFHKAHLEALAQQRQQYELPHLGKLGSLSHRYNGDLSFAGMSCEGSSLPYQNEQNLHYTSMLRSLVGGSTGGRFTSSLLEDLKNNKSRTYELSDIVDHVVECSMDQYGSRFIQQKLEIISEEEKAKIFQEIIPHARSLMIDVFGNYVIQKFFEHGTENQRKELACQLTGHVMSLALQMYGCRVIQKALEVVDVDRQSRIVAELDGAVMKCVRDQNGNHVIQKCIECVPHDRIQFIISAFFGQVVALSCHPYGCRVIQRVLENCGDPNAQATIMDEIMNSVCTLAQDQYGNYVIQHVLEHGKSHERSTIISKLTGQIVNMSQQKFASNVVEKCLTFGSSEERQLLVNEMLGSTDENEPLQAMMKDPFGNYVVQKVLETCNDHSRELILSRIKIHLNTLKRYTYGKHIVSRVEKLIAAAERQIKLSSSYSS